MITHPDYMATELNKPKLGEYPMAYYEAFLDYVKSRYAGQYWNVLPKDVTRWWRESQSNSSNQHIKRNVLSSAGKVE